MRSDALEQPFGASFRVADRSPGVPTTHPRALSGLPLFLGPADGAECRIAVSTAYARGKKS